MKRILKITIAAVLIISSNIVMAQNTGGTVTKTSDGVTIYELDVPIQGFLPPQLSLSEIIDMPNPPEGLMVYNTTKKQINVFNGMIWVDMMGKEMLSIGDIYGGGIVFYLDGMGGGLICSPEDLGSDIPWTKGKMAEIGTTTMGRDTGQANTTAIVSKQGKGKYAAALCDELTIGDYDDWFLPSKEELNLMHQNIGNGNALGLGNIAGFFSSFYWSSSEVDENKAWMQDFYNGNQLSMMKDYLDYVRAIRAF